MTNHLLSVLVGGTYRRSDLAYRVSLVRECLEYIFFTKRDAHISKEGVEAFVAHGGRSASDNEFLRALPLTALESYTQESFYTAFAALSEEVERLESLRLTVPVVFSAKDIEAFGMWARENVERDVLIDVDVDPSLSVGCRIVWNTQLHDYGLTHYLTAHAAALSEGLSSVAQQHVSA